MKTPMLAFAALLFAFLAQAQPLTVPNTLQGEVLEAKEVEAYTYLRLRTANGEVWAAVPRAPVRPGSKVTVFDPAEMHDFASRSLGRTFDRIYFGVLGVEAKDGAATAGVKSAANPSPVEPVARANGPDARTVAEIVGGRLELRDKPVTVRARVDRVSRNVMGKNWVHLRDGSGTRAEANDAVVATSQELPAVGTVVVARGIVRADVQVGSGHAFKVVLENASFK